MRFEQNKQFVIDCDRGQWTSGQPCGSFKLSPDLSQQEFSLNDLKQSLTVPLFHEKDSEHLWDHNVFVPRNTRIIFYIHVVSIANPDSSIKELKFDEGKSNFIDQKLLSLTERIKHIDGKLEMIGLYLTKPVNDLFVVFRNGSSITYCIIDKVSASQMTSSKRCMNIVHTECFRNA